MYKILTLFTVDQISVNEILLNTKYNKKTLKPILKIVESIFFLLVFKRSYFSYVIGPFVLRLIVGFH